MGQGPGRDIGKEKKKVGKGLMKTEEETQKHCRYTPAGERGCKEFGLG